MMLIIDAAQQQIKEGSKREGRRIQSNQVEAKYWDGWVWLPPLAAISGGKRSSSQRY